MSAAVDVVIAGAGPAGCAMAIGCARRGLEVVLLDRARFPRDKACGEGLNPAGVSALAQLGVLGATRAMALRLDGISFAVDDVCAWSAFPGDGLHASFGLGVRRLDFDALMVAAARAQPTVTFLEGVTATAPLVADGRLIGLATDAGPIRARVVTAADGLRSRLRAQLGLDLPEPGDGARVGLRLHLRVPSLPYGHSVHVLLDRTRGDASPGASRSRRTPVPIEHYLTPIAPDVVQVAVLGTRDAFARLGLCAPTLVPLLLAQPQLGPLLRDATPLDPPRGAGPLRQRVREVICDGALLVGDAAGYVDAITGEGMDHALRGGLIAADLVAMALAASRGRDPLPRAALVPWARAHAALVRDGNRLTELVLFLARHHRLARRAIASLARHPSLLAALLRVQSGAPLSSVTAALINA
jgi:flavin-dependent dehydrogenase